MDILAKLKEKIDMEGWCVEDIDFSDGVGWEISQPSPLGEDFSFSIQHNNDYHKAIEEISNYTENFDIDEHAEMWISSRDEVAGVPSSIKALVCDAEDIQEMLETLTQSCKVFLNEKNHRQDEMEMCI